MKYIIIINILLLSLFPNIACRPRQSIVCHTIKGYQRASLNRPGLGIYVDVQAAGTGAQLEFSYDGITDTIPVLDTFNQYNYSYDYKGPYMIKAVLIAGNKLRIDSIDIPAFNSDASPAAQ